MLVRFPIKHSEHSKKKRSFSAWKRIKPATSPHRVLCQLHPETLAEVTCESEPRAKSRLNEHIYQFPGDAADYSAGILTQNESNCRPMKKNTHEVTWGSHVSKLRMAGDAWRSCNMGACVLFCQQVGKGQDSSFYKFSRILPGLSKEKE